MRRSTAGRMSRPGTPAGAPYNRRMSPNTPDIDAPTKLLVQQAAALDARGAWREAIDAWTRVVDRAPRLLPARLALAQACIRAGRTADGVPGLERLVAEVPSWAAAWLALGVAQSMLGKHEAAVESASRAASLEPGLAPVHSGLGDVLRHAGRIVDAAVAYRRALELAPRDADTLNKVATIERQRFRRDEAADLLGRSLAIAPRHPYARVNLGTLELEQRRFESGRAMLERALAEGGLPSDARREAEDALAALREREAMAAPIADALAVGHPGPINDAVRRLGEAGPVDRRICDDADAIVRRIAEAADRSHDFPAGAPTSTVWRALEAHHNFGGPRTDEAIASSIALVSRPDTARDPGALDIVHYAAAASGDEGLDVDDPVAFEAWLRWRHAQLARHRPWADPGQLKVINNLVRGTRQVPRTPPAQFRATLRVVLRELAPRVPEGAWRIVFLYAAVLEMHPFADANGRVMRLVLNRLLVREGLFPHLRSHGSDQQVISRAWNARDLRPLAAWLAEGSRYAADLDRRWGDRPGPESGFADARARQP